MDTPIRFLIVEDSEADMILTVRELRRHKVDLTYVWVQTPEAMKEALNTQTFDVIVSDYSLISFNAYTALQIAKETGLDIPFIIVSGTVGEEAAVAAMKAGAHDFFSKDNLTRLMPAVEREMHDADERRHRRRVDDELSQAQNRFSIVFHCSPVPIGISRLEDSQFVDVNDAFVDVLGYSHKELVGHTADELDIWAKPTQRLAAAKLLSEFGGFRSLEVQGRAKSGNILHLLESAEMIDLGETPHIISILFDVSERTQMQQELIEAERMRVEIEKERELIQLKERFISVVSHEFRTPLAVIISSGGLVEHYYDQLAPDERLKYIREMLKQSEYMAGLIDDVLTVNKARAGRLEFRPESMDLLAFCAVTVKCMEAIDTEQHNINFVHDGELTDVVMDSRLLQHILVNLLTNAVKYSPNSRDVSFDVHREQDAVVIVVKDDGIGIPLDAQARLFEPFHRADNVGDVSGTGLGLAIVKESVDLHQGTIDCESGDGLGTRFTVRLPVALSSIAAN